MTVIACWLRREVGMDDKCIWAVADTRVGRKDQTRDFQVLMEHAPKIVGLSISGYCTPFMEPPELLFTSKLAVAFAGNSVGALSTLLVASSALARLRCTRRDTPPPALEDVAEAIRRIAERHAQSIGVLHPHSAPMEFVVFGACPRHERLRLFSFEVPSDGVVREVDLTPDSEVVVLGSGRHEVQARIGKIREGRSPSEVDWWIAPYRAVEQVIAEGEVQSVGGALQVVRATTDDVMQIATLGSHRPIRLFGLDLEQEIGGVDGWFPDVVIMETKLESDVPP